MCYTYICLQLLLLLAHLGEVVGWIEARANRRCLRVHWLWPFLTIDAVLSAIEDLRALNR